MINFTKNSFYKKIIVINCVLFFIIFKIAKPEDIIKESKDIEDYLQNLSPVEIFFSQTSENKLSEKGWMIISRTEKARIEFAPPNNMVLVADGKWFMIHDPVSFKTSYLPIDFGPFKSLINPREFFLNSNFEIEYKYLPSEKIVMKISFTDDKGNKMPVYLDMYFTKSPISLYGWKVIDSQKNVIVVKIDKIKKYIDGSENKYIFNLTEKMRNSGDVFRGPWNREPIKPKTRSGRGSIVH